MDIQNKTQIKAALRQSFSAVVYTINELDNEAYNTPVGDGKWSPGEILGHLILSTTPVSKALTTPKSMLEAAFGKNNREERTFEETKEKYYSRLVQGITASSSFVYNGAAEKGKEKMISKFTDELNKLLVQLDKWSEQDLSEYILPHPAIGKLTIREMLYSTHFHTEHHHQQILALEEVS